MNKTAIDTCCDPIAGVEVGRVDVFGGEVGRDAVPTWAFVGRGRTAVRDGSGFPHARRQAHGTG